MINLRERLTAEQLADYEDYQRVLSDVLSRGEHPWQKLSEKHQGLEPVDVPHVVPFVQPYDLDATCAVLILSPYMIAELMHGGIHPPIEAHLEQKILAISKSGKSEVIRKVDSHAWYAEHGGMAGEYVVDNRRCLTEVEGPLTYEQAIEYCIKKDVPFDVWGRAHNSRKFVIVNKSALPTQKYRNAWRLNEHLAVAS